MYQIHKQQAHKLNSLLMNVIHMYFTAEETDVSLRSGGDQTKVKSEVIVILTSVVFTVRCTVMK